MNRRPRLGRVAVERLGQSWDGGRARAQGTDMPGIRLLVGQGGRQPGGDQGGLAGVILARDDRRSRVEVYYPGSLRV